MAPQLEAHGAAYSPVARLAGAVLVAASRSSPVLILLAVLWCTDPPVTPQLLARMVLALTILPAALALLLRRASAARIDVDREQLTIRRSHLQIDVPCGAVERVRPWAVPLPGPGFSLSLRSGRRLSYGVQIDDPRSFLLAMAERAGSAPAHAALAHPVLVWAHTRAAHEEGLRPRWQRWAAKFPLFGLLPTAVLFNAHQHIAYGGLRGQCYLEGLVPYVGAFGVYWGTTTIYLVLYAGVLRAVAEALALATTAVAPARAAGVRRAVEIAGRVLYFGGVPALLALRFLA